MVIKRDIILVFFLNIVVFCFILICCDIVEVNFGGIWIVINVNKSIFVYGNVFGNVYIVLYKNGIIKDFYFWFNDMIY